MHNIHSYELDNLYRCSQTTLEDFKRGNSVKKSSWCTSGKVAKMKYNNRRCNTYDDETMSAKVAAINPDKKTASPMIAACLGFSTTPIGRRFLDCSAISIE